MSVLSHGNGSRLAIRLAVAGVAAALLAGCSSDATRLTDPFTNPFTSASNTSADKTPTASIRSAPTGSVESMPLAAPARKPPSTVGSSGPAATQATGANAKVAAATPSLDAAGLGGPSAGWSAAGGTPIVIAQGETAEVLSRRYGVPEAALLKANGFSSPSQLQPGTRLVIPVYSVSAAVASAPSGIKSSSAAVSPRQVPPHKVAVSEPKAAAAHEKKAMPKVAEVPSKTKASVATKGKSTETKPVKVESGKSALLKTPAETRQPPKINSAKPATANVLSAPASKPDPVKQTKIDKGVPSESKKQLADPTPTASVPAEPPAQDATGNPEFRWPARGRIIQGFKTGAGGNDGINIAVPEGTSVKAAEGGVVAYAGNELKGYGNLVLIRHPNGFVSAYAHNGELEVKRGEQVKRGQTIAKSGQSGNVASPQLHFELRKGSTPVDPTAYLAGL